MTAPDPLFAYGYRWGVALRAYGDALKRISDGLRAAAQQQPRPMSDEQREAMRELRYRLRIDNERQKGLRYVRRIAADARRDLGLTTRRPS